MNNDSGSALQKASFALLVFIAAALAYLIVRDRVRERTQPAEATASEPAPDPNEPAISAPRPAPNSFAPLRPRRDLEPPPRVVVGQSRPMPVNHIASFGPGAPTSAIISSATSPRAVPAAVQPESLAITRNSESFRDRTLAGRVLLRGTPPPEKPIALDAICARTQPQPISTRHFVVGEDGGLGNVLVYVKWSSFVDDTSQSSVPVLDNVGCEFQPYLLGVRAGQPFQIRNSDPTLHNAHALPKHKRNREFNLGLPVGGMTVQRTFDAPELFVQMKCDVHPWMFAYIAVLNHSWFTVTDTNGQFTLPIPGLPQRYTVAAVHVKAGEAVQEIQVDRDNRLAPLTFILDVPKSLAQAERH